MHTGHPKHVVELRQTGLLSSHGETKTGDTCLYPTQKESCKDLPCCWEPTRVQGMRRSYKLRGVISRRMSWLAGTRACAWDSLPAGERGQQRHGAGDGDGDGDDGGSWPHVHRGRAWAQGRFPSGGELMAEIVVLAALAHGSKRGMHRESSRPCRGSPRRGKSWHRVTAFRKAHPCSSPGLALWHWEPTSRNFWLPGKASAACTSPAF